MLSGTLCATLFVNLFVSRVVYGDGGVIRAGEGTIRAWYDFNTALHLLEFIQEIIYLRWSMEAFEMNFEGYNSTETDWIALYVNVNMTYFDSFVVEYIPKEIKNLIGNKNIVKNNYIIQANDSIMCRYFCIGFFYFMIKNRSFLEDSNLFYPNEYEKNDKIIVEYFQYPETKNFFPI